MRQWIALGIFISTLSLPTNVPVADEPAERWQHYVDHGDLVAYVPKGDWCSATIETLLTAPKKRLLKNGNSQLDALLKTVHMLVSQDCLVADEAHVVAVVNDQQLYERTLTLRQLKHHSLAPGGSDLSKTHTDESNAGETHSSADAPNARTQSERQEPEPVEAQQLSEEFASAARNGDVAKVTQLLGAGANVNARDDDRQTPLHWAAKGDALEVTKVLLDHDADPNARNEYGKTPLHYAYDAPKVVKELLDNGADVNAQDDRGHTPLHETVFEGIKDADSTRRITLEKKVAKTLIRYGADTSARDNEGQTPVEDAREYTFGRAKSASEIIATVTLAVNQNETPGSGARDANIKFCNEGNAELFVAIAITKPYIDAWDPNTTEFEEYEHDHADDKIIGELSGWHKVSADDCLPLGRALHVAVVKKNNNQKWELAQYTGVDRHRDGGFGILKTTLTREETPTYCIPLGRSFRRSAEIKAQKYDFGTMFQVGEMRKAKAEVAAKLKKCQSRENSRVPFSIALDWQSTTGEACSITKFLINATEERLESIEIEGKSLGTC